jgi:hypothetical protein
MGNLVTTPTRIREGMPRLAPPADLMPEPFPIWLAALVASRCAASANGAIHAVEWSHVRGRATYTNSGEHAELIQPLGVRLAGGDTVAVSWLPGETAYTVEVIREQELCA